MRKRWRPWRSGVSDSVRWWAWTSRTCHAPGHQRVRGVPDYLMLDATGLASHFGGEPAMARQIAEAFEQRGYCVRVAMAGTLGAAWALAHYATQTAQPLVPSVAGEPLFRFDVPGGAGCRELGGFAVVADPCVAVARPTRSRCSNNWACCRSGSWPICRVGVWRRVLAICSCSGGTSCWAKPEVLVAHHAPPVFQADMFLEHPTDRHPVLVSLLAQLLEQVARALAARGEGVLELVCRFRCTASAMRLDEHPDVAGRRRSRPKPCPCALACFNRRRRLNIWCSWCRCNWNS